MTTAIQIGIVGDRDDRITAHQGINAALPLVARALDVDLRFRWLSTDAITSVAELRDCHGLWCAPGSPYRSMDGALLAICHAREARVPFLGTCGGFQHAVLEHARHVLGWADADHAETAPNAPRAVITLLTCALVEAGETVHLVPGSRIARAYGAERAHEGYHCRYGLNPAFRDALIGGPLTATAFDDQGEVRAIEHKDHPFFLATLFQPERAALRGEVPPLVRAFVAACAEAARGHGATVA
jgi:CTP synthase (UTP-ammonia lyase)